MAEYQVWHSCLDSRSKLFSDAFLTRRKDTCEYRTCLIKPKPYELLVDAFGVPKTRDECGDMLTKAGKLSMEAFDASQKVEAHLDA